MLRNLCTTTLCVLDTIPSTELALSSSDTEENTCNDTQAFCTFRTHAEIPPTFHTDSTVKCLKKRHCTSKQIILLDVCYDYGSDNDILFNPIKSVYTIFKPKAYKLSPACVYWFRCLKIRS